MEMCRDKLQARLTKITVDTGYVFFVFVIELDGQCMLHKTDKL